MPIITPGQQRPRRVGLSAKQQPSRLLSQVGGQATAVKHEVPASQMRGGGKVREPKSIDAPPESSSDEEKDYRRLQDSDDDDDNGSQRVDIKPTTFNSSQQSSSQTRNPRRSAREKPTQASKGKEVIRNSQSDEPSSSIGSKRSAEEDPAPEASSHLTDGFGFTGTKTKKTKSNTRRPATYSSSQPKSSQLRLSQKSAPRSSAARPNQSPPRKPFKIYQNSPDSEVNPSPPAKRFIKLESLSSPEKVKSPRAFKLPSLSSSPSQSKPTFRHTSLLSDESPAKSKIKLLDTDDESKDAASGAKSSQHPKKKLSRKSKAKIRRASPETESQEFTQRPAFKLHALDELDDLDDGEDRLAAVFEDDEWDEVGDITIDDPVITTAKCPMCHEVVDAELLAKYSDRGRMNIKKQTAFCRLHKRQTALSSRTQKGYPKINWETLDGRLKIHQDFLKDILEGTQQSHYRDILKENVESGKNRTLLTTEDSLTPGYYGPRGLRAMTEYIMRTLSSVVRKRAIEDRLVSARGYTGYVQAVLVPELTVRLIMEDMDATEEDARKIMRDSIEVGEHLYEDIGDVIAGVSDEEEEP